MKTTNFSDSSDGGATALNVCFIAPLIHPEVCRDYGQALEFLEFTAHSISNLHGALACNLLVVCNEIPQARHRYPNTTFIPVSLPAPPIESNGRPALTDVMIDKGSKIVHGLLAMSDIPPEWVYLVDADDWVNRGISEQIMAASSTDSQFVYVNEGSVVNFSTKRISKKFGVHRYCGSTCMFRFKLLSHLASLDNYSTAHPSIDEVMSKTNIAVLSLILGDHAHRLKFFINNKIIGHSFRGDAVAWIVNTDINHSNTAMSSAGLPITSSVAEEYGLVNLLELNEDASCERKKYLAEVVSRSASLLGAFVQRLLPREPTFIQRKFGLSLVEANKLARSYKPMSTTLKHRDTSSR